MRAPIGRRMYGSVAERLAAWVEIDPRSGCHLWTGHRDQGGYGRMSVNKRNRAVHRVAWELVNGPIPEGMLALHICDNPRCCNPAHLKLGTQADNNRDRIAKGRGKGCRMRDLERYPQWR
ncbi:MAG: HNH endonuclease signature motif containing protein [Caulobacteraceae bacterium]